MFRRTYKRLRFTFASLRRNRFAVLLLILGSLVLLQLPSPIYLSTSQDLTTHFETFALNNWRDGRWQRLSTPVTTTADLARLYPGNTFEKSGCEGGLERIINLANWEWVGSDGHGLGWDGREFVVDLLRGGLALVGDETSEQHLEGITTLLRGVDHFYRTAYNTTQHLFTRRKVTTNGSFQISLHLNHRHPAAEELLDEAEVPKGRIDFPLVSYWRNDFLGSTREALDAATEEAGSPSFDHTKKMFLHDWLADVPHLADQAFVKKLTVVLNAGTHFGHSPLVDRNAPDVVLVRLFEAVVKQTFLAASTLANVRFVVRTSYPAEADCHKYDVPSDDPSASTSRTFQSHYGFLSLPHLNALLRTHLSLLGPNQAVLMDVERQALMRGDGRWSPEGRGKPRGGVKKRVVDCLLMCPTAMMEEWGRWTGMVLKGERGWGA